MVTHFKASSWASEAQGAVVSRGVTTYAGMTAHTVIVAQTKIGFFTGGQQASFLELPQDEQDIQLEEAYGRATVALIRVRSLCVILGLLDMKGLVRAATVIGSLMYGAGHVFKGQANFYMEAPSETLRPTQKWYLEPPMTFVQRTGTALLFDRCVECVLLLQPPPYCHTADPRPPAPSQPA